MCDVYTLGLESSCDETSAAVVKNGREVLSNVISSQIEFHRQYGGVVPEIASRKHVECLVPVVEQALQEAGIPLSKLDQIGVAYGPGLVGALLVGVSGAKALAYALQKPLIGVHHIEGHISANFIQDKTFEPPFLCLVVSGGHSHIVECLDYGRFRILGRTRDDAAGEAFDKIARALGLGYPGGPIIDRVAKEGDCQAIHFPRVHMGDTLDFSFSGPKTAVLNYLNKMRLQGQAISIPDVCASFQKAVVDILVENTIKAARQLGYRRIALAGGVASNSFLRETLAEVCADNQMTLYRPAPILCTDNGAMVACAAYYAGQKGRRAGWDLNAVPNLNLEALDA